MAIFQSPKKTFQRPTFPGKSWNFQRTIFAKFQAPKFENSEPQKNASPYPQPFHTPTRLPHIHIDIYIYSPRPICSHTFAQKWPFFPSFTVNMAPENGTTFCAPFRSSTLFESSCSSRKIPCFQQVGTFFLSKIVATDQSRGIYIYIYI